ncbi:PstS family phosphate ABC transporter substrate-binding protein [Chungangia koreensis]|uniref:PstS family phosphate ABC transporter substrate-binding protein n=1 Tax=Chungangia koreensis TaxID=752657 RepID=A0ABV8X8G5_9LACT
MKLATNIFYIVFFFILILFGGGFAALMLLFSGWGFLIPLLIAVMVILNIVQIFFFFEIKKRVYIYWVVGIGLAVSSFFVIPNAYDKTIATVDDHSGSLLEDYEPFKEGTKAVKLSEPSTYKIETALPRVDGATALYPIYAAFAQSVYPEGEYPSYNSTVMSNRTGEAYMNLINGQVDMIFALAPSKSQLKLAERHGVELILTPIVKESFVFFVNEKNPVNNLTTQQLKDIYSGKTTNWASVGGKSPEIRAFQRPEDSGSQTALQAFMGETPIMDAPVSNTPSLMGGIIEEVAAYKNYKNAIGYTFRFYSTEMVANDQIKLLSVDGVEPTKDTIRSGEYPIVQEFYAITAGSNNPHLQDFIDWILSPQGQEIVEKTGYVPIM